MQLNNLSILDDAQSRSISPENFSGEKGKGGMAGGNYEGPTPNNDIIADQILPAVR